MRCLHCGSTLSAFKKLTDSDFCSAEHRDSFYEDQQRLILARLSESVNRFQRFQRPAAAVVNPARVEPQPVTIAEAQAPAAIAALIHWQIEPTSRDLRLLSLPALDAVVEALSKPRYSVEVKGGFNPRRSLIPDLPWPRYNPGLLWLSAILDADVTSAQIPVLSDSSARAFVFRTAELLASRRPDIANRVPYAVPSALRMARPKIQICLDPIRLVVQSAKYSVGGGRNLLPWIEIEPIEPSPIRPDYQTNPISLVAAAGIPASLRLASGMSSKGVAFLDRIYKMRPRTGVLSGDVPTFRNLLAEPLPTGATAARPTGLAETQSSFELAPAFRFARLRPGQAVPSATAPQMAYSASPVEPQASAPFLGYLRPPAAGTPAIANAHLCSPELTAILSSGGSESFDVSPGAPSIDIAPAFPVCDAPLSVQPAHLDKFFRSRPRGPVPSQVADFEILAGDTADYETKPIFNSLPNPELAFQPVAVASLFRIRPRAAVGSESLADLESSSAPEVLLSQPLPPSLQPSTDPAPAMVGRMFRPRPRTAVACVTADRISVPPGDPSDAAVGRPATPGLPNIPIALAPELLDRLVRSRPRTGVVDARLASSIQSAAQPVHHDLAPLVLGAAVQSQLDFAPRMVERVFKVRPRSGVMSAGMAEVASVTIEAMAFSAKPEAVTQSIAEGAPLFGNRLFRSRPRPAVDAFVRNEANSVEALPFPGITPEFMPDWWDVLHGAKPMFVNKMYRMKLKQPAQDPDTVTREIRTKHIPAAEAEPMIAAMPPAPVTPAPSFLDRLYRMRPKGGKAAEATHNDIPCNAIEPRTHYGTPVTALLSVSRQWKSTPLRIKSLAATVPVLMLLAALPWSLPTEAAAKPLRAAIVRRAAIDHASRFAEGLSHWKGAERWQRTASGAIQPSGLGLFQPSLKMRDYRFAFSTQLHKGGVGFVVRATDDKNYQAVKLKVVKPGPLPTVSVLRWSVIDGVKTNSHEVSLPMTVRADTQYRISVDVKDQSFTLMVQDQLVDFWTEEQLKSGGAGFFGDKGERASIHSVRMTHQDDAIGKLFAALTLQERSSD